MRRLARISYGWFLWEALIIYAAAKVFRLTGLDQSSPFGGLEFAGAALATIALAIAAGTVSYWCLELPATAAARRARRRPRHAAAG